MRKIISLLLSVTILAICVSACVSQPRESIVKSQRRFEKYVEPSQSKGLNGSVDLSDGKKVRYQQNFGPKNLDFDIKIDNPY